MSSSNHNAVHRSADSLLQSLNLHAIPGKSEQEVHKTNVDVQTATAERFMKVLSEKVIVVMSY